MSTHITITAAVSTPEKLRTFTLPRVAPDEFKNPGRNYEVKLGCFRLNSRPVCRCELTAESPSDPATVILKFATARGEMSRDALERREEEAIRYVEDLRELQGKEVPEFLGFYKGEDLWGNSWACILLEDCGDNVGYDLFHEFVPSKRRYDDIKTYRIQLGLALARFHLKTHLNYNNISTKHIVVRGDRLVLVNFNEVETHDCQFQEVIEGIEFREIIEEKLPDPQIERIHCEEIYEYCTDMQLFTTAGYTYMETEFIINAGMKSAEDIHSVVKRIYPEPELARNLADWCEETWQRIEHSHAKYARVPWSMSRDDRKRYREEQKRQDLASLETPVEVSSVEVSNRDGEDE